MARVLKMQDRENSVPSDRLFYRIGEVSRITGLKPHVLRYWESEFKVIKPHKAGSLQRLYRKKDLDLIRKIKTLLYEEGFTIAGAKKKIRELDRTEDIQTKLRLVERTPGREERELLKSIREELQGIREILESWH